jgi:hypothetical protein
MTKNKVVILSIAKDPVFALALDMSAIDSGLSQ